MAGGGEHHGTRAVLAALVANAGIAAAKFVAFAFTGSASMLAEGIHSCADTGNQALLLLGSKRARREPTALHPFGFGRERYFWAFVVAVVLFTVGATFAIYEGIEKIRHPHEIESLAWAISVLLVAIVLEAFSFRTALVEASKVKGSMTFRQFIRRSRSPELPVVLLEDLAAQVGLIFALIAVVLASVTDEPVWDGIGTLAIGLLLGVVAIVLAIEMKSMLIGEAASEDQEALIRSTIEDHPAVRRLIHARTLHIGPDDVLVAAKVEFAPGLSGDELAVAIDSVESTVRQQVPLARLIYVEPDVFHETADAAAPGG